MNQIRRVKYQTLRKKEMMDSESEVALVKMKYSNFYDSFETQRVFLEGCQVR